jgi:signal transduction histidine kinase
MAMSTTRHQAQREVFRARVIAPLVSRGTYQSLLFQLATGILGSVGLALIITGATTTLVLAITPLVVPLLIAFRLGVGYLAAAGAALARHLLGENVNPPLRSGGRGFWGSGFAVLKDHAFWQQLAYLLAGWLVAVAAIVPFSLGVQALAILFYYDAVDGGVDFLWNTNIDTLGEALEFVPVGVAPLVAGLYLVGPLTRLSRALANRLLSGDAAQTMRSPAELSALRMRALTIWTLVTTSIAVVLFVIWDLTTPDGYFWPVWPLLSLALLIGIPGWVVLVLERREITRAALGSTALAIQIGVSVILVGFLVAIWAITTGGYFWPVWPALGLALAAAIHAAVVYGQREHRIRRLEETRAGAVEVQESELRRIERDLHDGAQARLVALGMSLGMAEQALEQDPEAVRELLADARRGAGEALEELRVLARGIRPPILTDRGLGPAISALTARTPLPVTVSIAADGRYPAAVETAAYFTVAEALANAIKHGSAQRVDISISTHDGVLVAEVVDDGNGGANLSGPGLTGLRQRAEALDGRLKVESPPGGPTTIRAELPCGS